MNVGLRPILSAKRPNNQIPTIMPQTVTAVHKPGFCERNLIAYLRN